MRNFKKRNIIYVILLSICIFVMIFRQYHTFTQEKWNAHRENRYLIVKDMIDKYDILNMNRSEIIELLGENNEFKESGGRPNRLELLSKEKIDYYFIKVGIAPEYFEALYIIYDDRNKVSDFGITRFGT